MRNVYSPSGTSLRWRVAALLALLSALLIAGWQWDAIGGPPAHAAPRRAILPAREFQVPASADHPAYAVYAPEGVEGPRTALVVLHGMGGNGPSMASLVRGFAQVHGWVVVAPTIPYGDWRDPNQLTGEELRLLPQLANVLDYVPAETGVVLAEQAVFFGFSRGAQAALRFTMLNPNRVRAVVAVSAGTYTVPATTIKTLAGTVETAPMPFGVADIEQRGGHAIDLPQLRTVPMLVAVGATDNRDGDVPRQWDPYVGKNRVERAQRFTDALGQLGCQAQVTIVPATGHELSPAMMEQVFQFLDSTVAASPLNDAGAPVTPVSPAPQPTRIRGV